MQVTLFLGQSKEASRRGNASEILQCDINHPLRRNLYLLFSLMNTRQTLAIIGSGPSCIYVLKNILDRAESFKKHLASIDIFEKRRVAGMGMPYNSETTAPENMCNITSEEMPALLVPFVDWLKGLDATHLAEFDIQPEEISDKEVYSRLALGEYFHAQYQSIVASLSSAGISVLDRAHCTIVDIIEQKEAAIVVDKEGKQFPLITSYWRPDTIGLKKITLALGITNLPGRFRNFCLLLESSTILRSELLVHR